MRGRNHLDAAGVGSRRLRGDLAGDGLRLEAVEQDALELRVQVRLGLFDEQQDEVELIRSLKLEHDRGDEQQVRVSQPGLRKIRRLESHARHVKAERSQKRSQLLLPMLDVDLAMTHRLGDGRQMLLHASNDLRGGWIVGEVLQRTVGIGTERVLFFIREHAEDFVEALAPRRIERCHRVAERWEVDVGDSFTILRLRVGDALEPCRMPQPMAARGFRRVERCCVNEIARIGSQRGVESSLCLSERVVEQLHVNGRAGVGVIVQVSIRVEPERSSPGDGRCRRPQCVDHVALACVVLADEQCQVPVKLHR